MGKSNIEYKEIFKSTAIFAFVRIFQMLIGIVRNKLVAIILGPSGIGILQIFDKTTELIKKGAGLGISQSALRDISVAKNTSNSRLFSDTYIAVRRITVFTGSLGMIITILLSPFLSKWTCGDTNHIYAYVCLSSLVFFNIFSEIQLSILKGVRFQRALAYASIAGSLCGLFVSVPIYYFGKEKGIVPAMIIQSLVNAFVTNWFVCKIKYIKCSQTIKQTLDITQPMIKVGVILVFVGVLDSLFAVILSSFLRNYGGFETVGFYQAGYTLIYSYFGIIVTSLSMDYYPRVSAVNSNNKLVANEYNKQVQIGLMFILPLASLFVYFAPIVISLLYTEEFLIVIDFVDYAILGAVLAIVAECLRIILVAKQVAKMYATISLILKACFLPLYMLLFIMWGLKGLGIAYLLDNIIQVFTYSVINGKRYNIKLNKKSVLLLIITLISIIIIHVIRVLSNVYVSYILGFIMISCIFLYSNHNFKLLMGDSLLTILARKMKIKK